MRLCRSPLMWFALLAAGAAIAGASTPVMAGDPTVVVVVPTAAVDQSSYDPFEDTNRAIFQFNENVEHSVLFPVANAYTAALPSPVRQSVHNFLQNLNNPDIFANDMLQLQGGLAGNTVARLVINSTVGIGGLFDPAAAIGIPYHGNDFGITLATWGMHSGPYIVLPVLGPSNERDVTGYVADSFADPGDQIAWDKGYWWATIARSAASGVDELSRNIKGLEDLEKTSLDLYATIRSLYAQRRAAEIRHENSNLPNPAPVSGSGD
jgi:phospholipid-binding lipoprotein MlaA